MIKMMLSVSLDGFFEGPDQDISWHLVDDEVHEYLNEQLRPAVGYLNGRVSFEMMAAFWPTADQEPDVPRPIAEFAHMWRETPQIVYSRTLQQHQWADRIFRDVVPEEVRALQAELGGDLVVGGADVADAFRRHDLIDTYQLNVHPLLLGQGRQLFAPGSRLDLRLLDRHEFGNGVVSLTYGRA